MDRDDYLESLRRLDGALSLFHQIKAHVPLTHLQLLVKLQDDIARIVVYKLEDVMEELGGDELALPRRLNLIRDIRDQARNDLLVHQLRLAGMEDDLTKEVDEDGTARTHR